MAARTAKTELHDTWRERIQASMLVNRLNDHILGKTELEQTQIKAIEILMARVAPTLSAVEQTNVNADDKLSEDQILTRIAELIDNHPDLLQRALAAKARKQQETGATVGATDLDAQPKAVSNQ